MAARLPSLAPAPVLPAAALIADMLQLMWKPANESSSRMLFISGAGVSTESGIPDYRSPGRPAYKPLQHADFVRYESTRRRYWARSYTGYDRFSAAQPGDVHHTLARVSDLLHAVQVEVNLITQNVDRLHHRAGSRNILELHGTVHEVSCQDCGHEFDRRWYQSRLEATNGHGAWKARALQQAALRPDGDVELPQPIVDAFRIAPCERCGSEHLKPKVVWFGGNVPNDVTAQAARLADTADACVVFGSTLSTYSAFRLVRTVAERGKPVGIINLGATRADGLPGVLKIEASLGPTLQALARGLERQVAARVPPEVLRDRAVSGSEGMRAHVGPTGGAETAREARLQ